MVVLREKVNVEVSRNLPLRAEAYYTFRHRTVLTLQKIKETEEEFGTRIIVRIPKKNGEG